MTHRPIQSLCTQFRTRLRLRLVLSLALVPLLLLPVHAVRPLAGDEVPPVLDNVLNEECTASILNQTVRIAPNGAINIPNVPAAGLITRVCIICNREDGTILGGKTDFIELVPGEPISFGFISLAPIEPSVETLELASDITTFTSQTNGQLSVIGHFSDGSMQDLSTRASGTVYTSSNAAILMVGDNGLLTPVNSGSAIVSVVNDGVFTSASFMVTFGDDSDGDGLPDDYETANMLNPDDDSDAGLDPDVDGLTSLEEFQLGTDPNLPDTDGDGLNDGAEAAVMADPLFADSDFDGVTDGAETDPTADPDTDGMPNVLDPDSDNDGLPDGLEVRLSGTTTGADPNGDVDGDGLVNADEAELSTDPQDFDTDDDGVSDGQEVVDGTDPLVADTTPPVVEILSPVAGADLVEGETLEVIVQATDDTAIRMVEIFVDGVAAPAVMPDPEDPSDMFAIEIALPTGQPSVELYAVATDLRLNFAVTPTQTHNLIPDPLTTVTGVVVDPDGAPVQGADVIAGGQTGTTNAQGQFSIANVPTLSRNITASASAIIEGEELHGSASAPRVRGGATDVGTIMLIRAVFEEELGTPIVSSDDTSHEIQFTDGFTFPFFGVEYTSVFVGSNGYVTFTGGDGTFNPLIPDGVVFGLPRIAPFFTDVDPRFFGEGGGLYTNQFPDRFVVTWYRIAYFSSGGTVTVQITLFDDGRIQFAYNGITQDVSQRDVSVAVSPGGVDPPPAILEVDFDVDAPFSSMANEAIFQNITNQGDDTFDLDGNFILFEPNANGGYDVDVIPIPGFEPPQSGSVVVPDWAKSKR